jgi:hypothetical protein
MRDPHYARHLPATLAAVALLLFIAAVGILYVVDQKQRAEPSVAVCANHDRVSVAVNPWNPESKTDTVAATPDSGCVNPTP